YSDHTYEMRQPLLFGEQQFGAIRIGISMVLVKAELQQAFRYALQSVVIALIFSTLVAMALAQWMLRPIHVIQSGLTRLRRVELPEGREFKDLGSSFDVVSAQLSESRAKGSQATEFESIVDNLEDAVALYSPEGKLIFSNPAMDSLVPQPDDQLRALVDRT